MKFIDSALALAFRRCNVDPQRIALAGFSDGATYSLSMGVANGDLFNELIAFSPGYFAPPGTRGTPRVFVAHGTSDPVLSFAYTRDHIVPTFERAGYDVRFVEFDGGHTVTRAVAEEAMQWFVVP